MKVQEAIMTTGISLEMIISKVKAGELGPIVAESITNKPSCIYQSTLDTAGALNRIIWGNSAVAIPQEPVDDHIIIDINGTVYDLMTGKTVNDSTPIELNKLTANTYAIEDKIRILCRPGALGEE